MKLAGPEQGDTIIIRATPKTRLRAKKNFKEGEQSRGSKYRGVSKNGRKWQVSLLLSLSTSGDDAHFREQFACKFFF